MTLGQPYTPGPRSSNKKSSHNKIDMDLAYGEDPHLDSLMGKMYDSGNHLHELLDFANRAVDEELLPFEIRDRWRHDLGVALEDFVDASIRTTTVLGHDLGGVCDMERAGVAMFRY